jgi:hypothetical protein
MDKTSLNLRRTSTTPTPVSRTTRLLSPSLHSRIRPVVKLTSTHSVVTSILSEADHNIFRINFFKQAFPFLDSASFVEMYFPFVATSPALFKSHDPNGAAFVGTGSTLYNNDGTISAVGQLLLKA